METTDEWVGEVEQELALRKEYKNKTEDTSLKLAYSEVDAKSFVLGDGGDLKATLKKK